MKVSQIEKAIATFEAEIAMLQKCVKQLRDQQPWRVAKPARVRKAKKAEAFDTKSAMQSVAQAMKESDL